MKNVRLSKEELKILDEILDFYLNTALYFPFSTYMTYKTTSKKIENLKSKFMEGS